jgi:hypothetical protein
MKKLTYLFLAVLLTSISFGQSVEVKDNNDEMLIKINDEGTNKSSITLQNSLSAPGVFTDKLYNVGHSLFWNGGALGTGPVWTLNGSNAYYNAGNVGIGTITPFSTLSVGGNGLAGSAISGKTTDDYGAGIYGEATGTFAIGVLGKATNTTENSHYGGFFEAAGMNGIGVYGKSLEGWAGYFIGKSHFDGYVGIGTSSPTRPLTVYDPTVSYAAFQYSGSGNGVQDGTIVGAESSGAYLWNNENTPLTFATNNTPRIFIAADGNVGVGTLNPKSKLSVGHDGQNTASIYTEAEGSGYGLYSYAHAEDATAIKGYAATSYSIGVHGEWDGGSGGKAVYGEVAGQNATAIYGEIIDDPFGSCYAGYFLGRAYFSTNVGIGEQDPAYKLDIAGPCNLNNGLSGTFLLADGVEAAWYNGDYFSWGFGGNANYFADKVGIGISTPSKTLYVNGSAGGTQGWNASDMRYKRNIRTVTNSLEGILKLRGVEYEWKNPSEDESTGFDNRVHYGVIAQEIEEVFPNLIDNQGNTEEMKHVEYNGFTAILIEAIKEQQKMIEDLSKEVELLKTQLKNKL